MTLFPANANADEFELVTDVCHQWDPQARRFVEVEYQRLRRREAEAEAAPALLGQGRVPFELLAPWAARGSR